VDPYARIIAEHMAKTLGRSIIVENRQAATGNISAQFMIDAPADGQLIWVGTQALTEINPSVFANLRWKIDDFLPLIKGVQAPLVFVAHPSVPAGILRSSWPGPRPIAASSAIPPIRPARHHIS